MKLSAMWIALPAVMIAASADAQSAVAKGASALGKSRWAGNASLHVRRGLLPESRFGRA